MTPEKRYDEIDPRTLRPPLTAEEEDALKRFTGEGILKPKTEEEVNVDEKDEVADQA